jgi:hypothetical protein
MRGRLIVLLFTLAWLVPASAQSGDAIAELEPIVVSGVQPGPGLWKVSRGGHVLWVLGVLSPVPRHIEWQTDEVAQRIGESRQVLDMPTATFEADVGFFGRIALAPSLIGARNNPERRMLADVVPAGQYARWSTLKQKYIGRSGKVEKWRPLFAAMELYKKAIDNVGLRSSREVVRTVRGLAEAAGVELVPVRLEIEIDDPRAAVRQFKKSSLADLECFDMTLDRIEDDLGLMARRANAWASGDLDALRRLPYRDQMRSCMDAALSAEVLRERGIDDLEGRVERIWLEAAKAAIARNDSSFAMLPMDRMVDADGFLAQLRAQGYRVEAPDEPVPEAAEEEDVQSPPSTKAAPDPGVGSSTPAAP